MTTDQPEKQLPHSCSSAESAATNPPANGSEVPTEPTLTVVLAQYAEAGFAGDAYVTDEGLVMCGTCGTPIAPDRLEVHSIRRLEGESDPSDMSGVLAVICPVCESRSTLVLRFGPEATIGEQRVWRESNDLRGSSDVPSSATPAEADAAATREPA